MNACKTFIPVPGTVLLAFIESLPRPCQSGEDRINKMIRAPGGKLHPSPSPLIGALPVLTDNHSLPSHLLWHLLSAKLLLPKLTLYMSCPSNFISDAPAP